MGTVYRKSFTKPLPLPQVSKGSGIAYASLVRFMSGERSLRFDKADKLAVFFELNCNRN